MTTYEPSTEDVELPRAITSAWMEHLGYTAEAIKEAEQPRDHSRCDFTGTGWLCIDENDTSHHTVHDEMDGVAALVMFVLERAAGRLLPSGGDQYTEWGVEGRFGVDGPIAAANHDHEGLARRLVVDNGNLTLVRRTVTEWPDGSTFTTAWEATE